MTIVEEEQDREASLFAMMLLIPTDLIHEDLKKPIDLLDEKAFDKLCNKYQVPQGAMLARIIIHVKTYIH